MKKNKALEELESLQRETTRSQRQRCRLIDYMETLSDEEKEGVQLALANPAISGTTIARFFERREMKISGHSIQRHRRKACTCD